MILDLTPLQNACSSLQEAIANASDKDFMNSLTESQRRLIIAGVIQNFEFTYELSWKFIKRWLRENVGRSYVDGTTRWELYRMAAENKLIDDVDAWMLFHAARNQTTHTYDEQTAQEVFAAARDFLPGAKQLLCMLQARND